MYSQSAQNTAWTRLLMVFNYYSLHCVNDNHTNIVLQCYTSSFECVNSSSLNLLLFIMNNGSTYIATVHQHVQCFDISRGETQVNNGERPGISTTRLFLPYDQTMTFDWMWTVMRLIKRETVCG